MSQPIFEGDYYIPGTNETVEFRAVIEGDGVGRVTAFHYNADGLMVEDADGDRARALVARALACDPEFVATAIVAAYREAPDTHPSD